MTWQILFEARRYETNEGYFEKEKYRKDQYMKQ